MQGQGVEKLLEKRSLTVWRPEGAGCRRGESWVAGCRATCGWECRWAPEAERITIRFSKNRQNLAGGGARTRKLKQAPIAICCRCVSATPVRWNSAQPLSAPLQGQQSRKTPNSPQNLTGCIRTISFYIERSFTFFVHYLHRWGGQTIENTSQ